MTDVRAQVFFFGALKPPRLLLLLSAGPWVAFAAEVYALAAWNDFRLHLKVGHLSAVDA
jgi:hypothetical protein